MAKITESQIVEQAENLTADTHRMLSSMLPHMRGAGLFGDQSAYSSYCQATKSTQELLNNVQELKYPTLNPADQK